MDRQIRDPLLLGSEHAHFPLVSMREGRAYQGKIADDRAQRSAWVLL